MVFVIPVVPRPSLSIGGIQSKSRTVKMKLQDLKASRLIFRSWYYFRLGYGTYLTFLLGFASTLVTVYYLAVRNMPTLLDVFPHFGEFAVLATVVGVPLSVAIGWVHLKRSGLYTNEVDVGVEANPYNYKLTPGIWKEAFVPIMLVQLRILKKMSETRGLLAESEKNEIEELESKIVTLLKGGYIGSPKRGLDF